jgi:hypothetical protein
VKENKPQRGNELGKSLFPHYELDGLINYMSFGACLCTYHLWPA